MARPINSRRGPKVEVTLDSQVENRGHGDLRVVARFFAPTNAYLLLAFLESNEIPAVVADAHMVQANQFLSTAVGGVRVMVPESHFERALQICKAFEAGEYQLDDDFDVGQEIQ